MADQVRVTNRLRDALKSYFPQALELAGEDLTSPMACALPAKMAHLGSRSNRSGRTTLRKFYYAHHSRSEELIRSGSNSRPKPSR